MTTNTQTQIIANPVEFINFQNRFIFIYGTSVQKYISIKAITDVIGIDWRNVKRNLEDNDNTILYGVQRILVPKIDNLGGHMTPQAESKPASQSSLNTKNEQNEQLIDVLCIRFDRVHIFLARINTSKVRACGNTDVADYLLKLQHEWADVLHNYETHGIAINKSKLEHTKYLTQLCGLYQKLDSPQQRALISKQIDDALDLQQPIPKSDKQGDLLN